MPDRYGDPHNDETLTAEERAFRANLRAIAIASCGLCDEEGYRPNRRVCDHREHSTPEGRAAAMAMFRNRKAGNA